MASPTPNSVHNDRILTNIAVGYRPDATYIADIVFPTLPVDKQTDKYYVYDKGDWFRDEARLRAPSTESVGGGYRVSTDSYQCDVFALHKDIDDQTIANTDAPMDADRDAVEWVQSRMQLRKEVQWFTDFFKTGVWGTDVAGVAAAPGAGQFLQWNDAASTPIVNMEVFKRTMISTTGYRPNTLVLGYDVWMALKQHPEFYNRTKYTSPDSVSLDLIARMFEVDRVLVSDAIQNTGNMNATETGPGNNTWSFIASKSFLLCYSNPRPTIRSATAGYRFEWRGVSDGLGETVGVVRIPMPWIRSVRIESQMAWDNKVIAADLGIFGATAVA